MSEQLPANLLEDSVDTLTKELLKQEQADCPVVHHFGPGLYIREVTYGAGTLVVGHFHKHPHLCIMLTGKMLFVNPDGEKVEVCAPKSFIASAGRKVAYILEDMTFQNVYATDETDVAKLEKMLFEDNQFLEEHLKKQDKLLTYDHSADVEDFEKAMAEYGIDLKLVRQISEYEEDQIPFPQGSYKAMVSDSKIEGKGLFATGNIQAGEMIAPARLGDKRTPAGRYTNHSKNPNAVFVLRDNKDIDLVASKPISGMRGGLLGEEITIDYRQALSLYKETTLCQLQSQLQ
jgi:hypothetical protein